MNIEFALFMNIPLSNKVNKKRSGFYEKTTPKYYEKPNTPLFKAVFFFG